MSRQIQQAFDKFQTSRREFTQTIAEHASRPENIPKLMELQVLSLLRPLLLDTIPSIQQTAALCLGRLANYSEQIAHQIVEANILPEIVAGLSSPDIYYKRNSCFVIRTISKHSSALAQAVVDSKALPPLVNCLESHDEKVREAAANAIASISKHSPQLAMDVVDQNAIPFLIISVQSSELSLKRISVAALGDIASHSPALAQQIIDNKAIENIAPLLRVSDPKLKEKVCLTLAQISKHSVESAELVIEGQIFPHALLCLKDKDANVRKSAATLIREISKHTQQQAQLIINMGGAAALVEYLKPEMENEPLHAVMSIGYIASFSQSLSTALINEDAPAVVLNCFVSASEKHVKAACAWALGQLGKHSPEHASSLTKLNALEVLMEVYLKSEDDLRVKVKRALKLIIEKCVEIEALQPLIGRAEESVLRYVLEQIAKLLPKNPKARVPFVTSGGFQAVQKIQAEPGSKIREYIDAINNCYPDQAVRYYSPEYSKSLVKEIEGYDN